MKIKLMRLLLRLFWLFPVKDDQVVLTSFNGRLFSCNPKYLALGLAATGKYKVYYVLKKDRRAALPEGIVRIDYRSLKHFFLLMTSKYIVVNSTGFAALLPYRKSQVLINTWHGAGLFKVNGKDIFTTKEATRKRQLFAQNTSFFLSSSRLYSRKQSSCMEIELEKFIPSGLPRDDIFFEDHPEIILRVKDCYGIDAEKGIILYAPTYRDGPVTSMKGYGFVMIDAEQVIAACRERFGKDFVFLFKAHHDMVPENISESCINASAYPDVQELLYAADVLISDYSSLQWDYSLQRKPGFLYSPDLEQYESVHPFASDYHEWPFETAFSNEELAAMIRNYDPEAGRKRIDEYLDRLGSYEAGEGVKRTLEIAFGAS